MLTITAELLPNEARSAVIKVIPNDFDGITLSMDFANIKLSKEDMSDLVNFCTVYLNWNLSS